MVRREQLVAVLPAFLLRENIVRRTSGKASIRSENALKFHRIDNNDNILARKINYNEMIRVSSSVHDAV